MMEEVKDLFAGFAPVTKEQWIAQATKDLKGAEFSELIHHTPEGIPVEPFYTKEDIGEPQPLFTHTDWEVCATIEVKEAKAANALALNYLNNGVTAINFRLLQEVQFEDLLQNIGIEYIAVAFQFHQDAVQVTAQLDAYLKARNLDKAKLNLTLNYDPIGYLINNGEWPNDEENSIKDFTRFVSSNSDARNICINGASYHNAGAAAAYELGCMLAHVNEYITWCAGNTRLNIQVNMATGAHYFTEIAKLRALRKVFALLLNAYGLKETIYIHATSAERNLTIYDQHNNLLRTTTEAMAAVAGGCDSLEVLPFDATYREADDFSQRIARNIQLILKGESYFDKVSDVAAGAYFIETLTEALAQKGWEYFKEIESNGGLIASLKAGSIQQTIEHFAAMEQVQFNEGKKVLVGINKYPLASQQMKDKVAIEINQPTNHSTNQQVKSITATRIAAAMEAERLANETAAPTV